MSNYVKCGCIWEQTKSSIESLKNYFKQDNEKTNGFHRRVEQWNIEKKILTLQKNSKTHVLRLEEVEPDLLHQEKNIVKREALENKVFYVKFIISLWTKSKQMNISEEHRVVVKQGMTEEEERGKKFRKWKKLWIAAAHT